MNDEEFKPSKPASKQPSLPPTKSSTTGSETRQPSRLPQPETRNLFSSCSSEAPENEPDKTSSEDVPDFVFPKSSEDVPEFVFPKPQPFSLSRFRIQAIATAEAISEGRGFGPSTSTSESSPVGEQKISIAKRIDSLKERITASKFSNILKKLVGEKKSPTDREKGFLDDLAEKVPFEIPVNILDGKEVPPSTSTVLGHRQPMPASKDSPSKILEKKYEIPGTCASEAFHGLLGSRPSSGEDYYIPESLIRELEDAMEDWTPPSESKSEKKVDPILGGDSLAPEKVERALARALGELPDVSTTEESSGGSSEGTPMEEFENHFK